MFSESNERSTWGLKSRAATAAGESSKYPQDEKSRKGKRMATEAKVEIDGQVYEGTLERITSERVAESTEQLSNGDYLVRYRTDTEIVVHVTRYRQSHVVKDAE